MAMNRLLSVKEICFQTGFGDTYVRAVKAAMQREGAPWEGGRCELETFRNWLRAHPKFSSKQVYFSKKPGTRK